MLGAALVCGIPGEGSHINTASLFELGVSTRALGMGGAFVAVADDAGAVFCNPARLPQVERAKLSAHFTRPYGAYAFANMTAAHPGWGVQVMVLDAGPLAERDVYGNPHGTTRYSEAGLVLASGFEVGGRVSIGLQARLYARAAPSAAYGASLSPALSLRDGPWTVALVWQNALSGDLQFAGGSCEPWIGNLAVGLSRRTGDTVYAIDVTEQLITRGELSALRLGAESVRFDPLVLRAGTFLEGSSFGASVHWGDLRLDVAYVLHYALPDSYHLSLTYRL